MEVEQFRGGEDRNFSYLVHEEQQAVVIDPFKDIDLYLKRANELGVEIIGVLNTHTHSDHTAGNKPFRQQGVNRLQENIQVGETDIQIIETPGHTNDSTCFYAEQKLFSGDTLFVGKIGYVRDKEQAKKQYKSLHKLLDELPPETTVYPGHDFGTQPTSTLEHEKQTNPFLKQENFEDFWDLKNNWQEYKNEHGID